jgi:hypothetical protein
MAVMGMVRPGDAYRHDVSLAQHICSHSRLLSVCSWRLPGGPTPRRSKSPSTSLLERHEHPENRTVRRPRSPKRSWWRGRVAAKGVIVVVYRPTPMAGADWRLLVWSGQVGRPGTVCRTPIAGQAVQVARRPYSTLPAPA